MKQSSSPTTFAKRLTEARARAGLSQAELAARLGVASAESISRYERGVREPRYGTVVRIAEALGIDPSVLLGSPAPSSPPPEPVAEQRPSTEALVASARHALGDLLSERPKAAEYAAVAVLAIAKLPE